MNSTATPQPSPWGVRQLPMLLRAEPTPLSDWATERPASLARVCVLAIVLGAGIYGAVMGSWSEPLRALYTGAKLPLVLVLTALGNSLLNAMLAPLLGLNVTFRQSLLMILASFAVMSAVLGGLAPVAGFVVWNTPPLSMGTSLTSTEYGLLQLTHASFIAFAGVMGNVCLLPLLHHWSRRAGVAWRVLAAWLAVNLLLGSQICWVLRPFIWDPAGPTRFIGREYLHGSFYETVFEAARRLLCS